jgi:hypothetical protein
MSKNTSIFIGILIFGLSSLGVSQDQDSSSPLLSVKEIMNGIITPTTTTIWGAYQLETDTEWLEVQNAALAVIGAGNLLAHGGAGEGEISVAQEAEWKSFNAQMIAAAREVIVAVEARNEEALSEAGNNSLYPPCESCHQRYQNQ